MTPNVSWSPPPQFPTTSSQRRSGAVCPPGSYLMTCNYYKNGKPNMGQNTLTQTAYITTPICRTPSTSTTRMRRMPFDTAREPPAQSGVTLVELLVSMVILGDRHDAPHRRLDIPAEFLRAFGGATTRSADAVTRWRARAGRSVTHNRRRSPRLQLAPFTLAGPMEVDFYSAFNSAAVQERRHRHRRPAAHPHLSGHERRLGAEGPCTGRETPTTMAVRQRRPEDRAGARRRERQHRRHQGVAHDLLHGDLHLRLSRRFRELPHRRRRMVDRGSRARSSPSRST